MSALLSLSYADSSSPPPAPPRRPQLSFPPKRELPPVPLIVIPAQAGISHPFPADASRKALALAGFWFMMLIGLMPLSPSLRNIRQADAIKAFVRLGGEERRGKGSHRVVSLNGYNLSIPSGILKIGLLKKLIDLSGKSEQEFLDNL